MKLLNTLCAIYLAAASSYAVAIALARNPALAQALKDSGVAAAHEGQDAAVAVNDQILQPGWVELARQAGMAADQVKTAFNPPPKAAAKKVLPAPQPQFRQPAPPPMAIAKAEPKLLAAPAVKQAEKPLEKLAAIPAVKPPQAAAERSAAVPAVPQLKPAIMSDKIAEAARPAQSDGAIAAPSAAAPVSPPAPVVAMQDHATSPADLARVEDRLKAGLTKELFVNFDLFIYVSKAERGPVAQRMYVFDKGAGDKLSLRYDWPVSTGEEITKTNFRGQHLSTHTPAGYYELDPNRMYRHYTSHEWGIPMPYAMFFNWVHDGDLTGLAIHSTYGSDEKGQLGSRASSGCVRLSPENAQALFELIHDHFAGDEARFATNRRSGTMSNKGELARDESGNLKFIKGYRVLVVIEDFGGQEVVAIL